MWSFFWASLYQLMDEIVMFLLFLPRELPLRERIPDLTRKGVVRDLF